MIQIDDTAIEPFIEDLDADDLDKVRARVRDAHDAVVEKTGVGSDMLGWRDLLMEPDDALLEEIEATARRLRRDADVLLCLGIGGSYLGARAVIDALTPYFSDDQTPADDEEVEGKSAHPTRPPEVLFGGHHLSGAYLRELLDHLEGKSVFVNVISKSGTTLETALSFRLVRNWMDEQFDEADDRIIVTTDPTKGALNELREERGYKKYAIPRDVGGRFSVLTPVGLLPIAAAGIDIRSFFYGAAAMRERIDKADWHAAHDYATYRYLMLQAGYDIEVLAHFEPRLNGIGRWWQQLFGESEGKEGTGLYPSVVQYSTDLHSLGQYMQEGQRTMMETFLMAEDDGGDLEIPRMDANLDGLNYTAGQTLSDVTMGAYEGTQAAHTEGGVPNLTLWIERIEPGALGELLYFFMHAVAVSGYTLGVNPFNQPGVEAYKSEMYDRLGR